MLPDIQPGNTKILYFFNCLLDGMHTIRRYICDFSHGRLNVRLSARIQPLLRGHKYSVFPSLGSVFGDTKGKKQSKVKKTPVKNIDFGSVVKNTKSSKSIFLTGVFL